MSGGSHLATQTLKRRATVARAACKAFPKLNVDDELGFVNGTEGGEGSGANKRKPQEVKC